MRQDKGPHSAKDEKEFVILLRQLGMNKNAAILLVFLTGTSLTTFREIESRTDLCESQISMAMKYLNDQGWIRTFPSRIKGHLKNVYGLTKPLADIVQDIEDMKQEEIKNRLARVRKLREDF